MAAYLFCKDSCSSADRTVVFYSQLSAIYRIRSTKGSKSTLHIDHPGIIGRVNVNHLSPPEQTICYLELYFQTLLFSAAVGTSRSQGKFNKTGFQKTRRLP